MFTNRKQIHHLDRLLTAVIDGNLPLENALQDEACRKDARLAQLLREQVETAQWLQVHSARTAPLPDSVLNGRRRLEERIRNQRANWGSVFWLKRLDWSMGIALTVILLFAGTAQLIGQFRHALAIAMPGDTLYFIKIAEEQARLDLAGSPEDRLRLYLEFARNRAFEVESLILEERFTLLPQALAGMESALGRAQLIQNQLESVTIPPDIQDSLAEIQQTVRHQVALVQFYARPLPAKIRADMERVAWIASDGLDIGGNP